MTGMARGQKFAGWWYINSLETYTSTPYQTFPGLQGCPFSPSQRPDIRTKKGTPSQTYVYIRLSISPLIHFTTSGYSLSTLPIYTYMYPHEACRYPSPIAAHGHFCSLISNTQQANARNVPQGALFHLQTTLNQDEKERPPPNLRILLSVSTPCQGHCDVNFTPYKYSLPDVRQSLHLARSRRCNINFTTSSYIFAH